MCVCGIVMALRYKQVKLQVRSHCRLAGGAIWKEWEERGEAESVCMGNVARLIRVA
uniref:Uncharacterized protein n=1 Tax=Anopheles atroparvus TaxID=41427 RepID=A0AAG5D284_ANOAO